MPAPIRSLLKAIGERLKGSKPGFFRALFAALTVGLAAAVATFKLLRSAD
jgi:hypothetical protein